MKKIIIFLISFFLVITLTGCCKKSVELTEANADEYIRAVETNALKHPAKNSASYYVRLGEVSDDADQVETSGYVYDKLSWKLAFKGTDGYVFENCVVTVTVKVRIDNIYQTFVDNGYKSKNAQSKIVTKSIDIKLNSDGSGEGILEIPDFRSPLNKMNGISQFEAIDMEMSYKGTETEK